MPNVTFTKRDITRFTGDISFFSSFKIV